MDRRGNAITICLSVATIAAGLVVPNFDFSPHDRFIWMVFCLSSAVVLVFTSVVILLWPHELVPEKKPWLVINDNDYFKGHELADYMAYESWWGVKKIEAYESAGEGWQVKDGIVHVVAIQEVSNTASGGKIKILGRKNGGGQHEEIPPTYWQIAQLSDSCLSDTRRCKTEFRGWSAEPIYTDLLFLKSDIRKVWPEPPWWWWG